MIVIACNTPFPEKKLNSSDDIATAHVRLNAIVNRTTFIKLVLQRVALVGRLSHNNNIAGFKKNVQFEF